MAVSPFPYFSYRSRYVSKMHQPDGCARVLYSSFVEALDSDSETFRLHYILQTSGQRDHHFRCSFLWRFWRLAWEERFAADRRSLLRIVLLLLLLSNLFMIL